MTKHSSFNVHHYRALYRRLDPLSYSHGYLQDTAWADEALVLSHQGGDIHSCLPPPALLLFSLLYRYCLSSSACSSAPILTILRFSLSLANCCLLLSALRCHLAISVWLPPPQVDCAHGRPTSFFCSIRSLSQLPPSPGRLGTAELLLAAKVQGVRSRLRSNLG